MKVDCIVKGNNEIQFVVVLSSEELQTIGDKELLARNLKTVLENHFDKYWTRRIKRMEVKSRNICPNCGKYKYQDSSLCQACRHKLMGKQRQIRLMNKREV